MASFPDSGWSPPDVNEESYVFTCSSADLPTNPLLMASVGNGHISTIVYHDRIFMNGLYNGEGKKSHRAAIPALNRIQLKPRAETTSIFSLDCIKGSFTEVQSSKDVQVQHLVCAHRTIPSLLVNQIRIERVDGSTQDSEVTINLEAGSMDLQINNELLMHHYQGWYCIWQEGRIDIWSDEIKTNQLVYGCQYYLLSSLPAQYDANCTVHEFYGLSPESLSCGDGTGEDYLGHVFWDQETWMYPPILVLHADIARELLNTRLRVKEQAQRNAEANLKHGVQFSWGQAVTGLPVSPSDDCEKYELHVSADVALALRQYFYLTGESTDSLTDLSQQLADYWISRLSWLKDKQKYGVLVQNWIRKTVVILKNGIVKGSQAFVILVGVMPPDEWHYPINNSAYTNMGAKLAISFPSEQSQSTLPAKSSREEPTSTDIYVPFDDKLNYHPEFDGYSVTDPETSHVKQADVILIGYPLDAETNQSVRESDLDLYEKVTTKNGPAMTWSMFCIGHMEVGQPAKAAEMYERQLLQATPPFQVWSEYPDETGAINFITGMGGFLQSLLNGYVGIRIRAEGIRLQPELPPSSSRLKVTGLNYHGAKFDIDIQKEEKTVMRTDANFSLREFFLSYEEGKPADVLDTNSIVNLKDCQSLIYQSES
ncbi:protein-glucosylgalactosylhydroxylysine glucosidase-like [Watersipora subatra]|uniref:protein-glucosylgalactosylhydroxylysine glucosidase-like n=1 Tax=Watersipora subatra TaxID=2589382 RepID=UPI00355C11E8